MTCFKGPKCTQNIGLYRLPK